MNAELDYPGELQIDIVPRCLLAVEGRNCERFFRELLKQVGLESRFRIRNFGGISEWRRYLETQVVTPDFESIESLGVIRDAELDAVGAFQSVLTGIRRANRELERLQRISLPLPPRAGVIVGDAKRVGVFVLPDCERPGMLESLCVSSMISNEALDCVDSLIECVDGKVPGLIRNREKSRFQAFIAVHRPDRPWPDQALEAGLLSLGSPSMSRVIEFLRGLVD